MQRTDVENSNEKRNSNARKLKIHPCQDDLMQPISLAIYRGLPIRIHVLDIAVSDVPFRRGRVTLVSNLRKDRS